jgi:hypothetical protein
MSQRKRNPRLHRGLHFRRVESDRKIRGLTLEVAFAEEWEKENVGVIGTNHGFGVLQDLMFGRWDASRVTHWRGESFGWPWRDLWARFRISTRDAAITATAIQWLGTNCGQDFLRRVFRAAGYELARPHEAERLARLRQSERETIARLESEVARLKQVERLIHRQREELQTLVAEAAR